MIEKRRWPRVNCEWEAVYSSISSGAGFGTKTSATVDLSEGGVRFRSNSFIPVGDRLRFTLRPPKSQAIQAVLSAVWVREIPSLSLFEIGGSFENTSLENRLSLRQWIDVRQATLVTRVPDPSF